MSGGDAGEQDHPVNENELAYMNVSDQAVLIAKKEISPVDLVELYLERIERWNPTLRAKKSKMNSVKS